MANSRKLTVSQLNGYIKSVFDDELVLHGISICGELSQLSVRDSATYFTLSEGGCHINCVAFSAFENLRVGNMLEAYGRVSFYSKTSKINFTVKDIKTIGDGELQNELNNLKAKLKQEGLFDNRLRPPIYISRVAVITSEAGAVIHDIMSVLRDKNADIELKVYSSAVQGDNAENSLINAIDKAQRDNPDVLLIARGGGSNYDLDVFNSEKLARKIADSDVPVISAVGHEIDYTLCDFCAGTRAGTPSIAAAIIADINSTFLSALRHYVERITSSVERIYSSCAANAYYGANSVIHAMDKASERNSFRLRALSHRLSYGTERTTDIFRERLKSATLDISSAAMDAYDLRETKAYKIIDALECSSPLKTLARGFAKVSLNGRSIDSVQQFKKGDIVEILLYDGLASAKISEIKGRDKL